MIPPTNLGTRTFGRPEYKENQPQAASKRESSVKQKTKGKRKSDKGRDGSGMVQLVSAFDRMESRYSKMEQTMEKKFNDLERVFQSKIDKFQNHMFKRFTEMMNSAVSTVKEALGEEIDELEKRIRNIEEKEVSENRMEIDVDQTANSGNNLNLVIRNLPEKPEENVKNEVNGLFKDGLRLRELTVESAERKTSASENRAGIVIAKLKSKEDKVTVMKNKSKLKDSRRYNKVL